jgi:hypothetical protein
MKLRILLACCAALALSVGVATATAGGGNSENAKKCQKGGWQSLVRSDGSSFKNQDECVSYGAKGGVLQPKPTCATGNEDFAGDDELSQPATFAGGTIDTAYGSEPGVEGGVRIQGTSFFGGFADGAHVVYTGRGVNSFKLTFTKPVSSVALDEQPNMDRGNEPTSTLTAYDASNNVVGTANAVTFDVTTLTVASATTNIKYFTIDVDDYGAQLGIAFTNIAWGCS